MAENQLDGGESFADGEAGSALDGDAGTETGSAADAAPAGPLSIAPDDQAGIPPAARARMTRRDLIALLGAGAVGAAVAGWPHGLVGEGLARAARGARTPLGSPGAGARVTPFELTRVRLLDGPFRDAQHRDLRYLLALEPDRLLHCCSDGG